MYHNIETLSIVISYLIKAVILAAQFSGRARKRQLKRVAQMDIDEKDKEIFFLRNKVYQQAIQIRCRRQKYCLSGSLEGWAFSMLL